MTVFVPVPDAGCLCDDPALTAPLVSISRAQEIGLSMVRPVAQTEVCDLQSARGRVLAAPVRAQADMPAFDNSGMDGYALSTSSLDPAGGTVLPVAGTSAAGADAGRLARGTAMRIFTGAPVPQGADAVIMQEMTERDGGRVILKKPPLAGENIRRRGEDMRAGDVVLGAGRLMDARAIAACAGAGAGRVTVRRALRVGLLLTGDELAQAGQPVKGGAIWDVNTPMLRGLIDSEWIALTQQRQVVDDRDAMIAALRDLSGRVDMIVTSGGVSVGDRDHVKPALRELGARIGFSGVAIKPGKPVTLSALGQTLVLSLPGNPVSACVTWLVFGRPLAARMAGLDGIGPARRHVRAQADMPHKPGRCEYRPARITGYGSDGLEVVSAGRATHSAQLAPLAGADGLVLIPAESEGVQQGDLMEFLPFPA